MWFGEQSKRVVLKITQVACKIGVAVILLFSNNVHTCRSIVEKNVLGHL
jgi:hypothetical protein